MFSVLAGFTVGAAFLALFVAMVLFLLQRRRSVKSIDGQTTLVIKRGSPDKPLTLKKPTAVRSPGQVVGGGVVLKKSPSPTGSKSPPGSTLDTKLQDRKGSSASDSSHLSQSRSSIDSSSTASKFSPDVETAMEAVEHHGLVLHHTNPFLSDIQEHVEGSPSKSKSGEECATGRRSLSDFTEDVEPSLGKLYFRLRYNYEKQALCVTIEKCADLVGKDGSHCDPYVKLHLIPEKQHKVKTRVLMRTRNPVYDEEFTFFGISPEHLETTSLNFVVLSFDRFSRDKIIGEVNLELAHLEFDALEKQLSFVKDINPRDTKSKKENRGELLVSLCYQPTASRLTVVVLKARNLPKMDFAGLCDPYVKIYLLYDGQRIAKKKTHIKKRTLNPIFNESFIFDVPYQEGLEKITLQFLLLDYERVTKNEVIGKLVMNMSVGGEAQKHWEEVAAKPRRQIAEWHRLQYCE